MSKLLTTEEFADACEFDDILNMLKNDAHDAADTFDYPIIHITDGAGNVFNRALLYEDTLTDGSKVYRIELVTK